MTNRTYVLYEKLLNVDFVKNHCFGLVKGLSLFIFLFFAPFAFSQQKLADYKLSPGIHHGIKSGVIAGKTTFIITIAGRKLPREIQILNAEEKKIYEDDNFSFFEIRVTIDELLSKVLQAPGLIFVEDGSRTPKEELQVSNLDLSVNKINLAHNKFPQLNGDRITVSVKENKPDTTDIDFKGRFLTTNLASPVVNSHASIMSTLIAGGGNTWHLGKGVAWGSTISSSNFVPLLPDALAAYQQYTISVQNHSYGVGIENYYGADAAAYDATVLSNPMLLHVFSAGNSGTSSSVTGVYSGLTGFANLTGSFKMAKNTLAVGATDSFGVVAALSSKGPAHDGRVKPELVAFGEEGSSGAAALTSGTALLVQHAFKQSTGLLPSSSLIKAVLINSADDVGNKEVDYATGYGNLNAFKAVKTILLNRHLNGSVSQSGTQLFNVSVPAGIKKCKVTLVWSDPPAVPNAVKALVNDLDLELAFTASGQSWKPWVLSRFPHPDSLRQLATRKKDSLNNVEQVTIDNPVAGNYQFRVTGYNLNTLSQNFYLAYQFDSVDVFEWQFPGSNDFVFSSSSNLLRWESSFAASAGLLEYSINNGITWQTIDGAVNLANGYYRWNTPPVISNALLRMTVSGSKHTNDTFTISRRTTTGVGFNCPDSFLFYWNKIPGINNYRVYKLGVKYLEPVTVTIDSFIVLSKNSNPSLHYAVAPLIGNREGMKSYTFNYTTQGVECYIRSFLSSLFSNTAKLELLLGTLYRIDRIILEKFEGTGFVAIQQVTNPASVLINFSDASLTKGLNIYRIKLILTGGGIIYSQQEIVNYLSGNDFIVYPNPVQQDQAIKILTSDSQEETRLHILNTQGSKIAEYVIESTGTTIPTGRLSKGLYFFRFTRGRQIEYAIKVFVY